MGGKFKVIYFKQENWLHDLQSDKYKWKKINGKKPT